MANLIAPPLDLISLGVSPLAPTAPETQGKVRGLAVGEVLLGGQVTNLPVTLEPRNTITGGMGYSTFDDYYETIHVRPALIDVGRLTAAVRREVEVWNAYRNDPRTLNDMQITAGDGISLDGPVPPFDFAPLESVIYTLEVTPNGPATIGARFELEFTTPERDPNWFVEGVRIIEWTIAPNWADGFEERFAFRTEVITAFNGSEQRIALRNRPRRFFAFTPLTSGARDRTLRRLLSTWQNRTFAMADWPRGVRTNGVPAGGQSVLLLDPPEGLEVGGLIVLRHGEASLVIEVEEIDGDLVRLNSPVLQAFPAGTLAYPGLTVHADQEVSSRRITSAIGQHSAQFREMHVQGIIEPSEPPVVWRETEVMEDRPNWREPVRLEHQWQFDWLDVGRGAFDYRTPYEAPKDIRRYTFTLRSREEAAALRDVFFRARGRRGEIFVPTWDDDVLIRPGEVLADGTTRLPIVETNDATRMDTERVYRNVCVRLADGTRLYRHVVAGDFDNDGPVLVVDEGWPRNIPADEVVTIHWMPRCRFVTDELVVNWITDGVAEVTVAFQTLEDVEEGDL